MDDVYRYIDENAPRFLDELKVLLRIPSVATDSEAVGQASRALKDHLDAVGMPSDLMESTGNPMVVGRKPGADGAPRVLLYGHYDVMPAGKRELWDSEPFEPTERDGRIYCRGVGDNKAQHFAHIKALEALRACGVETPPLKIVLEGEEETGSESLPGFVKDHRELLAAELCYAADGPRHESNRPTVYLGCRGVLGLELYVEGIGRDVHSGNRGNIVPNPAWKLVHVLASMRDPKGRVTIEGFEDDVIPPTNAERVLLSELPYDGPGMAGDLGVPELAGLAPAEYYERLMFKPTLTINGLVGGYTGEGGMTVIPGRCSVKMDIRMVVNQDPERMTALVRRHLDKHGFEDVKIEVHDAMKPSRTDLENRYADTIVRAVREASGEEPVVWPSLGGSIPQYAFVEGLGTPCIWSAYANWDEANHAPNENVHIHLFLQAVKMSANVFNHLREARA